MACVSLGGNRDPRLFSVSRIGEPLYVQVERAFAELVALIVLEALKGRGNIARKRTGGMASDAMRWD